LANIESELAKLNATLKAAKMRVAIFERDNHLWLRATLPPKPHIDKLKPYQQFISLNAKATIAGLKYAERKAKEMALALDNKTFKWTDWIEVEEVNRVKLFGELIEEYHAHRLAKSQIAPSTWKSDYLLISKKLPSDQKVDIEIILNAIAQTQPDTRVRKRLTDYCGRLAKFAKLPENDLQRITEMVGNYSAAAVNPRKLPSDKEIADFLDSIKNPGWRWVIGCIAAYGLRSHETVRLEIVDFPKLRVPEETKTGSRIVRPLYPEWAIEWDLSNRMLPNFKNLEIDNGKLTTKISGWFGQHAPFKALDLRHCYARRCFEFNIAPDRAAKMMGHGLGVHLQTYRAWFEEEIYDAAYKDAINAENSPKAPKCDG
jgi:integrase